MAANMPCDTISLPTAEVLVGAAHNNFFELGKQTYQLAVQNMNGLQNILLKPIEFTASFDYGAQLPQFQRPTRPGVNDHDFDFRDPGQASAPPVFNAASLQFDLPPEFTELAPVLTFAQRPDTPIIPVPSRPTGLIDIDVPLPPDYVMPAAPTLVELQLPDVPTIVLPEFVEDRPVLIEPPFNMEWTFEPQAYASQLLTDLQGKIRALIQGQEALPPAMVQAMFERVRSQVDVETTRAIKTVTSEYASRGFSMPQGMMAASIDEIVQTGLNKIADGSRDIAIKQYEESLANLRLALERGAALEGVTTNLHIEEQRLALQAATFLRESALAVVNYRISIFNAEMQAYQIDAQVFKDKLGAALAKIDIFKAQIEAERARGEINDQKVRVYESMLRGVSAMVEFYRGRVEAVKTQASVNQQLIDTYKADVEAYSERWRAHTAEWQGYSAAMEGESKKVDIYGASVKAQSERIGAWSTTQNLKLEAENLRLKQHDQKLDSWKAGLSLIGSRLESERGRLAAVSARVDAQARMYQADATIEQSATESGNRIFELGLRREQAQVDTELKIADMKIAEARGLVDQMLEIRKTLASVSAQLAASTMSAVSYNASVSSGFSTSKSCSQSFNFSGEIADA
jgi:hypothetical protein